MPKEKSIFETLFNINLNEHIEKKNGLSYISWPYAWAEVKKYYPDASYGIKLFGENNLPYVFDENTGYMVFTSVTIKNITHEMWLPVMDSANKTMKSVKYVYETKYKNRSNNWPDRRSGNCIMQKTPPGKHKGICRM